MHGNYPVEFLPPDRDSIIRFGLAKLPRCLTLTERDQMHPSPSLSPGSVCNQRPKVSLVVIMPEKHPARRRST